MSTPKTLREASCADDYDPNSMPVEKARALIRAFLTPVTTAERVAVRSALGRVLAADLVSPIDVPGHDNSAMDGYALRAADLAGAGPTRLRVAGTAYAGKPYGGALARGECVRIMTGAVMPADTDTVVMQEVVTREGEHAVLPPGQRPGQNRRRAGEDIRAGAPVLRRGQVVRPAELGLVASLGIGEVSVFRRLRVAFFSTGDELRSLGSPLGVGEIYDSNRYTIYGMLVRLGCEVLDLGVAEDSPERLEAALAEAAASADVVITSGGVSVGEADYIKSLLDKLGEVLFWKIAMKPGRPLAYGRIGQAQFFGLPGNPVSVMVTFYEFVREALLILQGCSAVPEAPQFRVRLASPLKKAPGRTEFQRGILVRDDSGEWTVRATGEQGSGILSSMSQANCFIVLPTERGNVAAGEMVEVQPMDGLV
jgi:molybdopterin molybdotransferase